jgi:hypothetical protein
VEKVGRFTVKLAQKMTGSIDRSWKKLEDVAPYWSKEEIWH